VEERPERVYETPHSYRHGVREYLRP